MNATTESQRHGALLRILTTKGTKEHEGLYTLLLPPILSQTFKQESSHLITLLFVCPELLNLCFGLSKPMTECLVYQSAFDINLPAL